MNGSGFKDAVSIRVTLSHSGVRDNTRRCKAPRFGRANDLGAQISSAVHMLRKKDRTYKTNKIYRVCFFNYLKPAAGAQCVDRLASVTQCAGDIFLGERNLGESVCIDVGQHTVGGDNGGKLADGRRI